MSLTIDLNKTTAFELYKEGDVGELPNSSFLYIHCEGANHPFELSGKQIDWFLEQIKNCKGKQWLTIPSNKDLK